MASCQLITYVLLDLFIAFESFSSNDYFKTQTKTNHRGKFWTIGRVFEGFLVHFLKLIFCQGCGVRVSVVMEKDDISNGYTSYFFSVGGYC